MKTNTHLYGHNRPPDIPQDIIDARVEAIEWELSKEQATHFSERNQQRINDLIKGSYFWRTINSR